MASVRPVRDELGITLATAGRLVRAFVGIGLLQEVTGGRRNRVFRYTPYLEHVADREPGPGEDVPHQTTEAAPDSGPRALPRRRRPRGSGAVGARDCRSHGPPAGKGKDDAHARA